jgi:hypothetical protein
MPVYVCFPGLDSPEPWQSYIDVFAAPYEVNDETTAIRTVSNQSGVFANTGHRVSGRDTAENATDHGSSVHENEDERENDDIPLEVARLDSATVDARRAELSLIGGSGASRPPPHIRRLRHAEIIIVDDVCLLYSRYWLRLRWPGRRGGFAGYIEVPMTAPDDTHKLLKNETSAIETEGSRSNRT